MGTLPKFSSTNANASVDIGSPTLDVKSPNADLNVEAPSLDVDIENSYGKVDVPSMDINAETPSLDIDIDKPSSKFDINMPNISLPKFELKGKTPEADIDVEHPGDDANIKAPTIDVDIERPSTDFDINLPSIKMPKFGFKGKVPKGEVNLPDASMGVDSPNLQLKTESSSLDISGPSVGMKNPNLDIDVEAPTADFDLSMPKIKMPSLGIKGKVPKGELDAEMKGDVDVEFPEAEVNASLPEGKIDGAHVSIQGPSLDVDVEKPSADFDVSMPKLKMPKFGMKGKAPKGEADISAKPLDVNVDLPSSDVDVPQLSPKGSAEGPTIDAGIKTPKKKFRGPACLQGEKPDPYLLKLQGPKSDLDAKSPKVKGEINVDESLPSSGIEVTPPSVKANANVDGDIDMDAKKPKFSGFSCLEGEKPDPHLLKLKGPKADVSVDEAKSKTLPMAKSPKCLQGELELEKPMADLSFTAKGGEPTTGTEKSKGKFDFQLPEAKIPSADFDVSMPSLKIGGKGDAAPKQAEAEILAPAVEIGASAKTTTDEKKKSQGFSCLGDKKAEKPDPYLLRLQGPRAEVKDMEANISPESGNIQIDVSVPKSDANLSAPK